MTKDRRSLEDRGSMSQESMSQERPTAVANQVYKFQRLEIYQLALTYIDLTYEVAARLPRSEDFGLKSQMTRAANSIALNIAEGSTSQTDPEQARFLGMALRSLIETVACHDIIQRRNYASDAELRESRQVSTKLFAKIQAMRRKLNRH